METKKVADTIIRKVGGLDYPEPSISDDNYVITEVYTNGLKQSLKCKTARGGIRRVRVHVGEDNIVTFYDDSGPDVKQADEIPVTVEKIRQFIQQLST